MNRQFLKRLAALVLCLALTMPVSAAAWADEAEVPETAVEETALSETDEQEPETVAETETAAPEIQADTVIETEAANVIETAAETEAETEESAQPETETETVAPKAIKAFAGLSEKEKSLTFSISDKPSLDELAAYMPKTLTVTLADGRQEDIKVTWKGPEDYE